MVVFCTPKTSTTACREGDPAALDIIRASGQMIGDVLAGLVNFFNPSHIFIGGWNHKFRQSPAGFHSPSCAWTFLAAGYERFGDPFFAYGL